MTALRDQKGEHGNTRLVRWIVRGLLGLGGGVAASIAGAALALPASADDGDAPLRGLVGTVVETVVPAAVEGPVGPLATPLPGAGVAATDVVAPVVADAVEPAVNGAGTPMAEPITQKVVRPVAERVASQVATPVLKPVGEVATPAVRPIADAVAAPVAEPVARAVAPVVTEVVSGPVLGPVEPVVGAVSPSLERVALTVAPPAPVLVPGVGQDALEAGENDSATRAEERVIPPDTKSRADLPEQDSSSAPASIRAGGTTAGPSPASSSSHTTARPALAGGPHGGPGEPEVPVVPAGPGPSGAAPGGAATGAGGAAADLYSVLYGFGSGELSTARVGDPSYSLPQDLVLDVAVAPD